MKNSHCVVCGNIKTVIIRNYPKPGSGIWDREKTCDYYEYDSLHRNGGEQVHDVFCGECGIKYHIESI